MGVLERILEAKRAELDELSGRHLPSPPARRPFDLWRPAGAALRLMTEIKRRSPSAGPLSTRLTVAERAAAYERAGATAVSVLCDRQFFDGDFAHLAEARDACSLPLLCKEFVLDERQLDAARAWGADAVLLIVRCLPPGRLGPLLSACRERELEALVEVATDEEASLACQAEATLIGVNARDIDSLEMDANRARRILGSLPANTVSVHLSGLRGPEDVSSIAATPAHAALIGETLMRQDDPEPLLRALVDAAGG